jgi:transcriptional regulator with XRE-family HTH domain
MADADLLDAIKRGFELKNDSELAGFLGVTRATIHNARYEEPRKLGRKARFFVLDRMAFLKAQNKTGQWIEAIGTRELAERLISKSNGMARRRALRHLPADGEDVAEKDLIEVAKESFECQTDDELAAILGVARNTISAVRAGNTSLGLDPRLAILNRIEEFPLDRVKRLLESTDDLIEEIRSWKECKHADGARATV